MDKLSCEKAIIELMNAVEADENESVFQEIFERNPVIFECMGYRQTLSHPKLVKTDKDILIPDFLAQRLDGIWEVLELKRPDTKVLRDIARRPAFYAGMEEYYSQCIQYSEYFDEGTNRHEFQNRTGKNIQKNLPAILIAGRSENIDRVRVHNLLFGRGQKVLHQTYDDIIAQLEFDRARIFGQSENLAGLWVNLFIRPHSRCVSRTLLEIGAQPGKNRVALTIDAEKILWLVVIDAHGDSHRIRASASDVIGHWTQIMFEVGMAADYATLAIQFEMKEAFRSHISGFKLELPKEVPIVLGADFCGTNAGLIDLAEILVYLHTPTFHARVQNYQYFSEKYPNTPVKWLEYPEGSFMHSRAHPLFLDTYEKGNTSDFVQMNPRKRPIFRDSTGKRS